MIEKSHYRSLWLPDLLGILFLASIATIAFLTPTLDIRVLSLFHQPGPGHQWPHEFDRLWRTLYTIGTWPALITALTGLCILVVGLYRPKLARWRRHAAFLFLTLVLGPGFFVNTLFKDHWGRPRPRQVTELGGTMAYQCFYERGIPGRGKSFPCGHSSMGYYFVVFYFLARRRNRKLALAALAGAMAYGTLIGTARMAAGAHFASDVLWSAFFPCFVAWLLYYFILRIPQSEDHPEGLSAPSRYWRWLVWIAPPLAAGAIGAVLLATPAFTELNYSMAIPTPGPVAVRLKIDRCRVTTSENPALKDHIVVRGEARGFGWPWSRIRHHAGWVRKGDTWILDVTLTTKGQFSEFDGQIAVETPPAIPIIK